MGQLTGWLALSSAAVREAGRLRGMRETVQTTFTSADFSFFSFQIQNYLRFLLFLISFSLLFFLFLLFKPSINYSPNLHNNPNLHKIQTSPFSSTFSLKITHFAELTWSAGFSDQVEITRIKRSTAPVLPSPPTILVTIPTPRQSVHAHPSLSSSL